MNTTTKLLSLLLAMTLVGTACLGGSDAESSTDPAEPTTDVLAFDEADDPEPLPETEDRPCEGGAFPDDEEFKQALCNVQWAQTDVLRNGGEFDPTWVERQAEATLLYGTDRDAALAALAQLEAEMLAAAGGAPVADAPPATADDIEDLQAATAGLQDCMVEVGFLIIDAQLSGFDPTQVDEWDADIEAFEALADDGQYAEAEAAICTLRDEIAAAIDDPSLVGG